MAAGIGSNYTALKHELISSYIHKGTVRIPQVVIHFNTDKSRYYLQPFFSKLDLKSNSGSINIEEEKRSVQLGFHRRIRITSEKLKVFGGLVAEGKELRRISGGVSTGKSLAINHFVSLSPSLYFEYPVEKDQFTLQYWTSALNYVKQFGYALSYPTENRIIGPENYRDMNVRLSYNKHLSNRFNVTADYQWQIYSLSTHEKLTAINHLFTVLLCLKTGS